MRYRIGTLIHDCLVAKGRDAVVPHWDRGNWFVGIQALEHRKPICPHCKKTLSNPLLSNKIEEGNVNLFSSALRTNVDYPAIFIEKVDLRKREYK